MSHGAVIGGHRAEPGPIVVDRTKDPEKARREKLDRIAETRREKTGIELTADNLKNINDVVAALDGTALVDRADQIVKVTDIAAGEAFSDDTPNQAYDTLLSAADQLLETAGDDGRRQARQDFMAREMGYSAADGLGTTSDAMMGLISLELGGTLPTTLRADLRVVVKELAEAWRQQQTKVFARLAMSFDMAEAAQDDLADHLVYMSLVSSLRTNAQERIALWNDRSKMLAHVEGLIDGMEPGEPVDLGTLYTRADALMKSAPLYPPQTAEVVRLALAALSEKPAPTSPSMPPLPPTPKPQPTREAAQLMYLQGVMEGSNELLINQGLRDEREGESRKRVIRAADYDLGDAWSYLYGRQRTAFPTTDSGKTNADKIDKLVANLPTLLTALSEARRSTITDPTAKMNDVADKAASLAQAFNDAETGLRSLIGNFNNLEHAATVQSEIEVLRLVAQMRGRAAELCEQTLDGTPASAKILDGPIAAADVQVAKVEKVHDRQPNRIQSLFDAAMEEMRGLQNQEALLELQIAVADWADAATKRRAADETAPDLTDPTGTKTTIRYSLRNITYTLITCINNARTAAQSALPRDRIIFNRAVNDLIQSVSTRLRSMASVSDARLASLDLPTVVADFDKVKAGNLQDDVTALWKDATDKGIVDQARADKLKGALADWKAALETAPRDDQVLADRTWTALDVLLDYRVAMQGYGDMGEGQRYAEVFDELATTIASRLRALS